MDRKKQFILLDHKYENNYMYLWQVFNMYDIRREHTKISAIFRKHQSF